MQHQEAEDALRRERTRGHPTEHVGFRCPTELLEAASAEAPERSKGIVTMLDRAFDAKEELGKDWIEVVVLAHREGITEGQALGRLARAGLGRDRKAARK